MKWYKSWTLYFNAFAGLMEGLQYLIGHRFLSGPNAVMILAMGNIILRVLKTVSPIVGLGANIQQK